MSLIRNQYTCAVKALGVCLAFMAMAVVAFAQTVSTTTVQGTVYLANGSPGSGTLQLSWPAFTTASNQSIAAGKITTTIGTDGFVSVNLAPNLGSSPAGLYYTAIYHMSDGTTSTEYWVIPAAAQASIAQVRSQVMPAAQAVQAVSKAYVDQAVQSVAQGNLTSTGGQLTGPLYLTSDPTQSLQAADKHYVDASLAQAVPLSGGVVNGPLTAQQLGAAYQVDQFSGADFGAKLQACLATISGVYGGTCDARNFSGNLAMAANLTISTANTTVMLPCATISTASQIIVSAGTRNVSLRGCALRGASNASGSQGGTVLLYSGSVAAIQVGDPTYAADTNGFHLDNVVINTTAANSATAQALAVYRTQEVDLESLYLLGNANQTGMTLDGTGNYTGGTFYDDHISGFQTAINGVGHQVTNSAATDWLNASTFVRLHIDCPTANGNPVGGTYGVNLQQADGNTFTGGDVENCSTAVHLGANAQSNTIVGLRNENSTYQVVADAGSSYNSWMTGGTMFTGKLTDNGTRNSFLDTFHRSFNSLNGDWYGSQQDATMTNHYRLGIGSGDERGLLNRYQTDYGYRWTMGLSDATGGEQFYQVLDELNGVYRLSIGQYNNGQSSTNNQTVVNAAGAGAVVLNGSNNAGTGGVVFGSGGASESTVATVSNTGNAQFNGTLQVGGTSQSTGTMTVRNNADAEVDYYLWPGLTASQKGSFTYKDWNGNSQWYLVKDANNNWALNSATGGLDSFKAYQSTNSGDTYVNASNASGVVRVNYETGAGSAFNIYGGNSSNLYASFSGNTSIKFPGLSASSGHNCLQIDASGYITNTGVACGSGSGSGTVNSGSTGQIAYYNSNGTAISGMSSIPVSVGGTGATTAAGALSALGAMSLQSTTAQSLAGPLNAPSVNASVNRVLLVTASPYNAKCDGTTDDQVAIQAAFNDALANSESVQFPAGTCITSTISYTGQSFFGAGKNLTFIKGKPGQDVFQGPNSSGVSYKQSTNIHDLTILVDSSVNAAATAGGGNNTFIDRISGTNGGGGSAGAISPLTIPVAAGNIVFGPGTACSTGTITAGSHNFNCPGIQFASLGLTSTDVVGQPITINGAGVSGANLVTTIASITDQNNVVLTGAASTTVTNATGNFGTPFAPPWYFGNCAIALPESNGGWVSGPNAWAFKNVALGQINAPQPRANHTCGIFFQAMPYGITMEQVTVTGLYGGIIEALPNNDIGGSGFPWSPDTSTYVDMNFDFNTIPMITYNGAGRHYKGIYIYGGEQLFTFGLLELAPNGSGNNLAHDISGYFFEAFGSNSGENSRFTGEINMGKGAGLNEGAGVGSCTAWYANNSKVDIPVSSCVNIYGNGNDFNHIAGGLVNDFGNDNSVMSVAGGSNRKFYMNRPREPLNKLDSGFLLSGNSGAPYTSGADLLITCPEFNFAFQTGGFGAAPGCTNDPTGTEITKSYVHLTQTSYPNGWTMWGTGTSQGQGPLGKFLVLGDRLPQAKMNLVVVGRCNVSCTHNIQVSDNTAGFYPLNTSMTLGPTWTIQRFLVDLTAGTALGDSIGIDVPPTGLWAGGMASEDIAFYAFEPVNNDALNGFLAANNAWTGNETHSGTEVFNTNQTTFNAAVVANASIVANAAVSFTTANGFTVTNTTAGFTTNSISNGSGYWNMQSNGTNVWQVGTYLSGIGGNTWGLHDYANARNPFQVQVGAPNGSVVIGTSGTTIPTLTSTTITTGGLTVNNGLAVFQKGVQPYFIETGTASNADLTGRLTLSSATSASYTFTHGPSSGAYNQVNCLWQPRFNIGTVLWWDTSTGSAASVATSSPVSGTFAYFCVVQY
jgi:hypothetical protein